MKPTLNPYLIFNGQAAEAMKFYQAILGGELTIQTYGEAGQAKKPEEEKLVMHAMLKNDGLTIMASDAGGGRRATIGDNVHLSIIGDDEDLLTNFFNGLAVGGKIDQPLAKQFWGDTFGMLTDKFGIHWMVNINQKK